MINSQTNDSITDTSYIFIKQKESQNKYESYCDVKPMYPQFIEQK